MTDLQFERGPMVLSRNAGLCQVTCVEDIEVRCYARHWTDPIDWDELMRGTPGQPHVVTHACGPRTSDGAWLDGPLIVFGQDHSVIGAIPSGGMARISLPRAALVGSGLAIKDAIKLEERSAWRCLRALVADACLGVAEPLVLAGEQEDLRAALVLFAARQAHPNREILWSGASQSHEPWRRFLRNAAIGLAPRELTATVSIEPMVRQISSKVLHRCVSGAHRLSHVIPAVIVRDGMAEVRGLGSPAS